MVNAKTLIILEYSRPCYLQPLLWTATYCLWPLDMETFSIKFSLKPLSWTATSCLQPEYIDLLGDHKIEGPLYCTNSKLKFWNSRKSIKCQILKFTRKSAIMHDWMYLCYSQLNEYTTFFSTTDIELVDTKYWLSNIHCIVSDWISVLIDYQYLHYMHMETIIGFLLQIEYNQQNNFLCKEVRLAGHHTLAVLPVEVQISYSLSLQSDPLHFHDYCGI